MITREHRNMLLVADRTRDVDVIAAIVDHVLTENPDATLLEIEMCLRDGAGHSYLIANGPKIVIGMPTMLAELATAGITPEQNRAALAAATKE
jgi:hypothetical protein